jgi:RNA polymerase sigma-70 factor, ECF subfamily
VSIGAGGKQDLHSMDSPRAIPDRDAIRNALIVARRQWPHLDVSEDAFAKHVANVGALADALESHGADLVLACACAAGDERALSLFDQVHVSCVPLHVTRFQLSAERLDELQQLVRVKLFTGPSPRIMRYSGKGPLGAWLRIVSIRLAMDELQVGPLDRGIDPGAIDSLLARAASAETQTARMVWQPPLQNAIEDSLAELPSKEKTVLRLHYVEGLNIDAIGTMYHVHRATVARWLLGIRARVLARVREKLAITLPSTTSEMRGAFADLEGNLHVSLSRVLGTAGARAGTARTSDTGSTTA